MGKKIILSEAQFKNYMRRLMKESNAGGEVSHTYSMLSSSILKYAKMIEGMGMQYTELYNAILPTIKSYGVTVGNVSETYDESENPCIMIQVGLDNVQPYGNGSEDYESPEEWLSEKIEYELSYDVLNNSTFNRYFQEISAKYENGTIIVTPVPYDEFSIGRIKQILPDI